MSNILRTALAGGGSVDVRIRLDASGVVKIYAHEDYGRLDARRDALITAAELSTAEDPDALIHDTAIRLIHDCHIRYEGRAEAEKNGY